MHPNDAKLANVYTREEKTTISDRSFSVAHPFEIILEVEAGSTIFNDGVSYHIGFVLQDLTANTTNIPLEPTTGPWSAQVGPAVGFAGSMGTGPWSAQASKFLYTVAAADLANRVDHICQVVAFLRVGSGREPNVSFASSPLFLLHPSGMTGAPRVELRCSWRLVFIGS